VFVYKKHESDCTEAEIDAIKDAMAKHYPASRLLLIRLASDRASPGSVRAEGDKVLFGYLSRFVGNLDARFIQYREWRQICVSAMAIASSVNPV
jgi:hypothetical protein